MAEEIDLKPVSHLTTDAIGAPGKRVFYIQGHQDARTITVLVEKIQVQSLAIAIEQFLADIQSRFPDLPEALPDFVEEKMQIHPPVDPVFRVGELSLGFDREGDWVILVCHELLPEEPEGEEKPDPRVIRYWSTRSQLRALARWGLEVVKRGRPLCPQCGTPIDPEEKHFCPKKNGHHN